jgi:hypothetical protein
MSPLTKMFSPNVVVTVAAKLTCTAEAVGAAVGEAVVVPVPAPVSFCPVWIAMDDRAGTVAEKVPDDDTVKLDTNEIRHDRKNDDEFTYELPEHEEADLVSPLITLQYVPAGNDVLKVVDHAASALLMATNPAEPRPNAIWLDAGETHFVRAVLMTLFRNPTMPATPVQRCWHSHPLAPPLPEHVPTPVRSLSLPGSLGHETKLAVVRSTSIEARDRVAREDGRGSVWMRQAEDHSVRVLVLWRVGVQGVATGALSIVVRHENVRRRARNPALRFEVLKSCDVVPTESISESRGVPELLDVTMSGIHGRVHLERSSEN